MHVVIDDTYGPETAAPSSYVTGSRRTYVAVEFRDDEVDNVRKNVGACLAEMPELMGVAPVEFHFTDIYNRRGMWNGIAPGENLKIFHFFADIYRRHRWRVRVQTVDDRTVGDEILSKVKVDEIDLATREGRALFALLVQIKKAVPQLPEPLTVLIDAGLRKPGTPFAHAVFRERAGSYEGVYADSVQEPLVQIADFLAFSINRCTHLQLKPQRTDIEFLQLIHDMEIRCNDLRSASLPQDFTTVHVDAHIEDDMRKKGLLSTPSLPSPRSARSRPRRSPPGPTVCRDEDVSWAKTGGPDTSAPSINGCAGRENGACPGFQHREARWPGATSDPASMRRFVD